MTQPTPVPTKRGVVALDPGTTESAVLLWVDEKVVFKGIFSNEHILMTVLPVMWPQCGLLAIEQIRSYGMGVGKETFDTVHWSGRFHDRWEQLGGQVALVPRLDVKLHLCHTSKAKDTNIWHALTDRFGLPGVKKSPGLLFGVKSHERAALALAVYCADTNVQPVPRCVPPTIEMPENLGLQLVADSSEYWPPLSLDMAAAPRKRGQGVEE